MASPPQSHPLGWGMGMSKRITSPTALLGLLSSSRLWVVAGGQQLTTTVCSGTGVPQASRNHWSSVKIQVSYGACRLGGGAHVVGGCQVPGCRDARFRAARRHKAAGLLGRPF
jgi:hypothetical protein